MYFCENAAQKIEGNWSCLKAVPLPLSFIIKTSTVSYHFAGGEHCSQTLVIFCFDNTETKKICERFCSVQRVHRKLISKAN